jgi:adenine-specific DNA methylase
VSLERHFDPVFAARLSLREKQVQQVYRPIIGIHKWFARRPGTLFRNLLLAEFKSSEPLEKSYWHSHKLAGVVADPFMGGGIPLYEADRLGFGVVGTDVNPMAYWIVRQSLAPLDIASFVSSAKQVADDTQSLIGKFYETNCSMCQALVPVKYFIWVKTILCPSCEKDIDLFPGYLLAEAGRHPRHVVACGHCGALNEYVTQPSRKAPARCLECTGEVFTEGPARRQAVSCPFCAAETRYGDAVHRSKPPAHRMWAIEYYCPSCRPKHSGRFFKKPDDSDLARAVEAGELLKRTRDLLLPNDEIPRGDETDRLHRWGYRRYRDLFNERQLLGLGILLQTIGSVSNAELRHALLTVFSDFVRYQNMLCRYDTYALKCQDVFSVHGFPVGLVQCENNLLGIPKVGSGSFRHFVEKYRRAKEYCEAPFETCFEIKRKTRVVIHGEKIGANLVTAMPTSGHQAWLTSVSADQIELPPESLDGIFTDPPYFANVQYAELMDFCYVWLRLGLSSEIEAFGQLSTRSIQELTGNQTMGRDLEHFAKGLSQIYCHYAAALKSGAPLVFTYHHNDPDAYVPIVVAILDAGLDCSCTLPAVAEMSASMHILGTGSSVLDSVFVCRRAIGVGQGDDFDGLLSGDAKMMSRAGVSLTKGDLRCLLAGHIARVAVNDLRSVWQMEWTVAEKMIRARKTISDIQDRTHPALLVNKVLDLHPSKNKSEERALTATI